MNQGFKDDLNRYVHDTLIPFICKITCVLFYTWLLIHIPWSVSVGIWIIGMLIANLCLSKELRLINPFEDSGYVIVMVLWPAFVALFYLPWMVEDVVGKFYPYRVKKEG